MNKEKFILIINEHRNLIYKVCHTYCSNTNDHKDLEQEILMQLWNSMSKYDGRVKLSTWMYRVALNTAISFYRRERKRLTIDQDTFLNLTTSEYDTETDERIRQIYSFIEQLHELDKALMLLYLNDTRYKEISEILGLSESNVATKINRIKNKLKEQFQDK